MAQDTSHFDNFIEKSKAPSEWQPEKERVLLEPFNYLISIPGKEVRSQLIDAFNAWLDVPVENLEIVKTVVGKLHVASLLVDDVQDDSQLRRGIPVAHKIYGVPQTINSANYVYFLAYEELSNLRGKEGASLQEIVNEELLNLHRGQGMDLYWRDSLTCPTESEYIEMVNNKTGGLFRIAIKLMMATSRRQGLPDYVPLVNLIGVIFQIRDDYMNLQSDQYAFNKGYCEDLTEGKFSFPVVHSIRSDTTNQRIMNALRQRPTDRETKAYVVSYMETQTNSFTYTENVLSNLDRQAREEIKRLGGNEGLVMILDRMKVPVRDPRRGVEGRGDVQGTGRANLTVGETSREGRERGGSPAPGSRSQ